MRFFGVILIFIGLPLCIVPMLGVPLIIVGLFMIIAGVGSSNANKTANALAAQMKQMPQPAYVPAPAAATNADAEKWAALAKYDDEIREAIARLRTTYLALNDRAKLPAIGADIRSEFGGR